MEIKLNNKDIRKNEIFIIIQNHKVRLKTNNINKIRSWQKTMNYLKIKDYKIYRIEVKKLYDNYTNIYGYNDKILF